MVRADDGPRTRVGRRHRPVQAFLLLHRYDEGLLAESETKYGVSRKGPLPRAFPSKENGQSGYVSHTTDTVKCGRRPMTSHAQVWHAVVSEFRHKTIDCRLVCHE